MHHFINLGTFSIDNFEIVRIWKVKYLRLEVTIQLCIKKDLHSSGQAGMFP